MRWAHLLLGPVILAGLFSLVSLALETGDVPADADYLALREVLAQEVRAGDAVVAQPAWSLRVHQAARAHALLSGDDLRARPLDRWRRLFVVVEPDGEGLEAPASAVQEIGRLRLLRYDLPPRELVFDARAQLREARVRIEGKGATTTCDRPRKDGWACQGRKSWQRVSRERLMVSENSDEAVWAHPPPKGEKLVLRWEGVPLGERFVIRAGFTRKGAAKARRPVQIALFVDDEKVGETHRAPAFSFDSTILEISKREHADVELHIWTADNGAAHFAFDAFSSRVAP